MSGFGYPGGDLFFKVGGYDPDVLRQGGNIPEDVMVDLLQDIPVTGDRPDEPGIIDMAGPNPGGGSEIPSGPE